MNIKTAVIPVAGYGTRRLPITKAIEKCMLPIGNRPVVDYAVEECAAAGIERIIFVVGEDAVQLQTYYGHNRGLENHLTAKGKARELELIRGTIRGITIKYVTQPADSPYGTAVPLQLVASHLVGEEAFAVLSGDAFIYTPGKPALADAIKGFKPKQQHMMFCSEVAKAEAGHYGVVAVDQAGELESIIEKPSPDKVSEPVLVNTNNFLLSNSIFEHLESYMESEPPEANGGEYYLTDVIQNALAAGQTVKVTQIKGQYLDAGNLQGWLTAVNTVNPSA